MATDALLLIKRGAMGEVRRLGGRQRYRIRGEQITCESLRQTRDLRRRRLTPDGGLEGFSVFNERRLARGRRQSNDISAYPLAEFHHLSVFGRADHTAIRDGATIIN